MKLDCNKIVSYFDCEGSNDVEKTKSMYEKIGKYLITNAGRMASDRCLNTNSIEIKICLNSNSIVTIDRTVKEYLMEV